MPKPTDERIAAALAQGARVADVNALIEDLKIEVASAETEVRRLDELSIGVTTSEAEADTAADEANRARRRVTRLSAKIAALQDRVKELEASNRRKVAEAAYEAAETTRDALVKELRAKWPKLTSQMIDLFERIEASDVECRRVGSCYGKPELTSAEAIARGCGGNFVAVQHGISSPQLIERLTRTKLQPLDATDHRATYDGIWPKPARQNAF